MSSIGDLIDFGLRSSSDSNVDKSIEDLAPFIPPVFMKIVNDLKEKCNSLQSRSQDLQREIECIKITHEVQIQELLDARNSLLTRIDLLNRDYFKLENEHKDLIQEKNRLHGVIVVLEDRKKSLKKALSKIVDIAEREDSDADITEDPSHEVCDTTPSSSSSLSSMKNLPRTMHEFLGMRVESLGLKFIHFLQIFSISKGAVATGSVITQTLLGEMWMDTDCIDLISMHGLGIAKFLEKLGYTYTTVRCSYLQNVTQYVCFYTKDERTFKVSIIEPNTTSLMQSPTSHSRARPYTTQQLEVIPMEIAQLSELDCCRNYFDGVRFRTEAFDAIARRTYSHVPASSVGKIGSSFTVPRNDDRLQGLIRKYESRGFTRAHPSTSFASFHASVPTLNRK